MLSNFLKETSWSRQGCLNLVCAWSHSEVTAKQWIQTPCVLWTVAHLCLITPQRATRRIYGLRTHTRELKCSKWNTIMRKSIIWSCCRRQQYFGSENNILNTIIWCRADSFQSFNKCWVNGSERETEWQTLRCFQTDLHSITWNLFDLCLLLASHKHIFAYGNNARRQLLTTCLSTSSFLFFQRCVRGRCGDAILLSLHR